jgi:predicted ATP-dependent endonuclease of OLD family
VVTVHFATITEVKAKLNGVLNADTVDRQLDGMVANELAAALFAHRAFLVEGTTELSVFYGIGDKTSIGSLEAAGACIVPVGGKTSIPLAHAILTSIGIPVYALFDADGGSRYVRLPKGKHETRSKRSGRAMSQRIASH